jgi:hypothetical protein
MKRNAQLAESLIRGAAARCYRLLGRGLINTYNLNLSPKDLRTEMAVDVVGRR